VEVDWGASVARRDNRYGLCVLSFYVCLIRADYGRSSVIVYSGIINLKALHGVTYYIQAWD
jgi:hypothetical protein